MSKRHRTTLVGAPHMGDLACALEGIVGIRGGNYARRILLEKEVLFPSSRLFVLIWLC